MSMMALRRAIARDLASLSALGVAHTLRIMWWRKRLVAASGEPAMRRENRDRINERKRPSANERFETEGGHPAWVPAVNGGENEETRAMLMRDLAIGFDGRRYTFGGYRYEKLEDAVTQARQA